MRTEMERVPPGTTAEADRAMTELRSVAVTVGSANVAQRAPRRAEENRGHRRVIGLRGKAAELGAEVRLDLARIDLLRVARDVHDPRRRARHVGGPPAKKFAPPPRLALSAAVRKSGAPSGRR